MHPCFGDISDKFDASESATTICCEGPGGCGCPKGKECCQINSDPTGPVYACVQGKCENKCGGSGGVQCAPGQVCCKGECVDTNSDLTNCGACGNACPAGQSCNKGVCGDKNNNCEFDWQCNRADGERCCDGECAACPYDGRCTGRGTCDCVAYYPNHPDWGVVRCPPNDSSPSYGTRHGICCPDAPNNGSQVNLTCCVTGGTCGGSSCSCSHTCEEKPGWFTPPQ
jgi:hypothetical protein